MGKGKYHWGICNPGVTDLDTVKCCTKDKGKDLSRSDPLFVFKGRLV